MNASEPDSSRAGRILPWFVPVLATLWLVLRFIGLEHSPPGFYGDEIRAALHLICIGETGRSAYGERWPTFVYGAGGGLYTPPFLYWRRLGEGLRVFDRELPRDRGLLQRAHDRGSLRLGPARGRV